MTRVAYCTSHKRHVGGAAQAGLQTPLLAYGLGAARGVFEREISQHAVGGVTAHTVGRGRNAWYSAPPGHADETILRQERTHSSTIVRLANYLCLRLGRCRTVLRSPLPGASACSLLGLLGTLAL
mmetsp:Transcript_25306/g.74061  ORF Transcript_25306/g.74061 Transcript_25306/m.74061 type:complete len:125 (-) Transcript_25306:113-487(-)